MSDTIKATLVEGYENARNPGDFWWAVKAQRLHFVCPCGCGLVAGVSVQPADPHGWEWNQNEDQPTVSPSIDINRGHWHGYLTDGVFRKC